MMSQPKPTIVFYIDICSAFAYIAFTVVSRWRETVFKNCDVDYVPVRLSKIMAATNNPGPMAVENKAEYTTHDLRRKARNYGVPLAHGVPPAFGKSSPHTMAALTAIRTHYPDRLEAAFAAAFRAFWVGHMHTCEPRVSAQVFGVVFSDEDTTRIVKDLARQDDVLRKLDEQTKGALGAGAFGLPYFVATNAKGQRDVFFGFDHLGSMIDFLELERPDIRQLRGIM